VQYSVNKNGSLRVKIEFNDSRKSLWSMGSIEPFLNLTFKVSKKTKENMWIVNYVKYERVNF
jgi:hypothetical protein